MASLDDWVPIVLPRIPGCPEPIVREGVRESAVSFCRETKILTATIPVATIAGQAEYALNAPYGQVPDVVEDLIRGDYSLEPATRDLFRSHRWDMISGSPIAYYLSGARKLVLGPIPDTVETLTGRFVMRPSAEADDLDDALWEDWRLAIAAGARAYIRETYSAWDSPELYALDRNTFNDAVSNAIHRRGRGQTRYRPRIAGHYY